MMVRGLIDVCYDIVVCNAWHRCGGCLRTPDEEILKTHYVFVFSMARRVIVGIIRVREGAIMSVVRSRGCVCRPG